MPTVTAPAAPNTLTPVSPEKDHPAPATGGRGASRERAICTAMLELLNEVSYESVTMDAVAARAKAAKATIYRRWANKDELVVRAIQLEINETPMDMPDSGSLAGDITGFLKTQSEDDRCAFNTAAMRGLTYATSNDPKLAELLRTVIEEAGLRAWTLVLDRAHRRGELEKPVDAQLPLAVSKAMFFCRMGLESDPMDNRYITQLVEDVLLPIIWHQAKTAGGEHCR